MPVLAAFLGGIFSSLLLFFIKYFTKRVAVFLTVIAAITLLTTTFWVALYNLISAIGLSIPPEMLVFSGFLPNNIPTCLSIVLSAKTISYVYVWNVKIWTMKMGL